MKVKTYIAITSEICINTQFKNTLTYFIKSDLTSKRLVFLPVDWDKNGLLFTKRFRMTNKNVGYS